MEYHQNKTAAINHQLAIRIKCHDYSWLFHQSLKKTSRCREVILVSWGHALVAVAVEKRFIKTRVNVWTARRNKKTGRCRELAVSRGSTVFCLLHLLLFKLSSCHRRRRRTGDLTKPRRRRQRERQKTMGLMSKTTITLFCTFLCRHCTTTT